MTTPRIHFVILLALAGAFVQPAALSADDAPAKIVSVELRNLSDKPLAGAPVTFGQAFAKGEIPPLHQPGVRGARAWQVDVKRHHADGSVRFAVISMLTGPLDKDKPATVDVVSLPVAPRTATPEPVRLADVLKAAFDATVTFTFPDGVKRSASARKLIEQAGEKAATWLSGPMCGEWLVSGPPADEQGRADADLSVRFAVRAYVGKRMGEIGMVRVSVTVENCFDTWAGNIRYDAQVAVGGKEVFAVKDLDHRKLSRWRKVFWWTPAGPADAPPVHVVHDFAYLGRAGILPNYDLSLKVGPKRVANWLTRWQAASGDVMGPGLLTRYMPTTGGRPEIAPYPAWAVDYLYTQDPALKRLVLGQGELAGAWPIHVRSKKTGRLFMPFQTSPDFWLYGGTGTNPTWQPDRAPSRETRKTRLTPDSAHQGSFAYIPCLLTGDRYYLEEAYFWANFNLINAYHVPRLKGRGILRGQVRGRAWGLRNVADAAWFAADRDPEKDYLEQMVRNNVAYREEVMTAPQFLAAHPLGGTDLGDIRGNTKQARIHAEGADPDWVIEIPWQGDYLCWTWHHLVQLGWEKASVGRDHWLKMRVGMVTHPDQYNPGMICPYKLVTGRFIDGRPAFFDSWKVMGAENARLNKADLNFWYTYSARAALVLAADAGYPKADVALAWVEKSWTKRDATLASDKSWAFAPRKPKAR